MKKALLYQNLVFPIHGKTYKAHAITINPKYWAPNWNDKFELPAISYSIADIQDYFEYILKKHWENINYPSIKIYVNKIENIIIFKIKTGYYLELLTSETMKLVGSNENEIIKDKNGENKPHPEITEVILAYCNVIIIYYQQEICIHLLQINPLVIY